MYEVNTEDNRTTSMTFFWSLYFLLYIDFPLPSASIVDVEQINSDCVAF